MIKLFDADFREIKERYPSRACDAMYVYASTKNDVEKVNELLESHGLSPIPGSGFYYDKDLHWISGSHIYEEIDHLHKILGLASNCIRESKKEERMREMIVNKELRYYDENHDETWATCKEDIRYIYAPTYAAWFEAADLFKDNPLPIFNSELINFFYIDPDDGLWHRHEDIEFKEDFYSKADALMKKANREYFMNIIRGN